MKWGDVLETISTEPGTHSAQELIAVGLVAKAVWALLDFLFYSVRLV